MSDQHERVRRTRHTVEVALVFSFVTGVVNFIVGNPVAVIMGAAWLTCFVIYLKMRRLERSIR